MLWRRSRLDTWDRVKRRASNPVTKQCLHEDALTSGAYVHVLVPSPAITFLPPLGAETTASFLGSAPLIRPSIPYYSFLVPRVPYSA